MEKTVAVIAACVSTVGAIASVIFAYLSRRSYRGGLTHEFRREHDRLVEERSPVFWEAIRRAYDIFREKESYLPNDVQDLLRSAGPPPGLHAATEPLDYSPSNETPLQKDVWDFACQIYPVETRGIPEKLKSQTIIPESYAEDFFKIRSTYCGFWDRWASHLGPGNIAKIGPIKGQTALLIILAYLDITHRQWTNERRKGKGKMYELVNILGARSK